MWWNLTLTLTPTLTLTLTLTLMGGWLPGYVVDTAMAGTFQDLVAALVQFVHKARRGAS